MLDRLKGRLEGLLSVFRRGQVERELEEELRFHIDRETEKLVAAGVSPAEASRRAHVRFGGVERTRQEVRDVLGMRWLDNLVLDARQGIRTLAKTPVVAVVTILSLGLGIGASTAVFTIGNAFLFTDPGGLVAPENLVAIYTSSDRGRLYDETSFQDYLDIAADSRSLADVAAYRVGVLNAGDARRRDRIITELVTGNYFAVLGVTPALGRFFDADETVIGNAHRVMVLSYRAWQERFGGARDVVGREWRLDGEVFTVVGVAPEGLRGRFLRLDIEGWIPLGIPGGTYHATPDELANRGDRDYQVLGRLRSGATRADASAEMAVLAQRLHAAYPDQWEDARGRPYVFTVLSEKDSRVPPDARTALAAAAALLLVGSLMILLLVCANVGGVLLARAGRRARELAVRSSLGANRGRLIRLLLTESALLATAGGALGVYLAYLVTRMFRSIPLPVDIPFRFDITLDHRVVIFAAVVSVGAALAAGLAPALQASGTELMTAMKAEPGGTSRPGRRSRLRSFLVVFQVAVAVVILASAGLMFRSLRAGLAADPGMDVQGVAVTWASPPRQDLAPAALRRYFLDIEERLRARPEIDQVSLSRMAEANLMMDGTALLQIEDGGETPQVRFNAVTPGYLEMFGLRVIRGRTLRMTDRPGAPLVAVVNEAFLRRYLPGTPGPGGRIRVARWIDFGQALARPPATLDIVGVVADRAFPGESPVPRVWTSFLQDDPVRAIVYVRGRGSAASLVPILRQEIETRPDDVTLIDPMPYADLLDMRFMGHRLLARITALAGLFALILAVMGVYGVVSFAVAQRFREMAIRQAMGARRRQVVTNLLAGGMRMTAVGLLVGLALAVPLAFLSRSLLFGVSPLDPLAIGAPTLILAAAAGLASLVPTHRLLRTTPMQVLRDE
jgi:putative ABC transport system permease protein